jgi:hypothetical protein
MKKTALLSVAVLLAFSGVVRADGFNPSAVPASAVWILHVDMNGLKGTEFGRSLLAHPKVADSPKLAEFKTRFGLDPRRDLRSVTVYTVSTGRLDAAAVLEPEPAAAARFKAWREAAGFTAQKYGENTIYSRTAGPNAPLIAVTPDGRIVTALTLERVRQGLDVLDGKNAAFTPSSQPALADRQGGAGSILLLAGRGFGPEMQGLLPQITLLRKANSLCLKLGGKTGPVAAAFTVCADEEAEGERLKNALLGFIEIGRAMAANDGRPDFGQALVVTREGKTVRVDGTWTVDDVLKMVGGPRAP